MPTLTIPAGPHQQPGNNPFVASLTNMLRKDVSSRYTLHFQSPLVETDVKVRSEIGRRVEV